MHLNAQTEHIILSMAEDEAIKLIHQLTQALHDSSHSSYEAGFTSHMACSYATDDQGNFPGTVQCKIRKTPPHLR